LLFILFFRHENKQINNTNLNKSTAAAAVAKEAEYGLRK
jgi:hypothetical protein